MCIDDKNSERILQIKNSCGIKVLNEGLYYISASIFKNRNFKYVYYLEENLSVELKKEYDNFTRKKHNYENYMRDAYRGKSNTNYCKEIQEIKKNKDFCNLL